VGLSECAASAPLRPSRPRCGIEATSLESADAHAEAHAAALGNPRQRLRAARDSSHASGASASHRVAKASGHGEPAKDWTSVEQRRAWIPAIVDTKNARRARRQANRFLARCLAWRQEAANHHDFNCLRESTRDLACRQALHRARALASGSACSSRAAPSYGCDRDATRQGRSRVPSLAFPERRIALPAPRACLAAGLGGAYISRILVEPTPTRRPIRPTRAPGDLTVTTRSGVVAFHRSDSLASLRVHRVAELRAAR
jgi:hypothetical protein